MKNILKPMVILFCLAAAFLSCKKNTVAAYVEPAYDMPITDYDVIVDPTDAFTFSFKNKTTNYGRLEWRFGDDTLKFDASPSHTYLTTGKYTVDLKAFSKTTNQFTRKLIDINIVPDSIIRLSTSKASTGVGTATLKFASVVKVPIAKILWTFNDAATTTTDAVTTTSSEQNPTKTYAVGTFNSFTVTITTTKGSVVSITRNVTTEGIAEDITQKRVGFSSVLENGLNPVNITANEGSPKLIDGNKETKFGIYFTTNGVLSTWAYTIIYDNPVTVKLYAIANANDSQNTRDPKDWYLEGSNDGVNWTTLDYQANGTGFYAKATAAGASADAQKYKRFWYYPVAVQQPFSLIRLRFPTGTFGGAGIQLAEFQLFR